MRLQRQLEGAIRIRLLALVPRPRRHLVIYHGVLAPGASLRIRIVPRVVTRITHDGEEEQVDAGCGATAEDALSAEVAVDSLELSRRRRSRVPHRPRKAPGKDSAALLHVGFVTATGVSRGDLDVPELRRGSSVAFDDSGSELDRTGAAGDGIAVRGAGVGAGAGAAGGSGRLVGCVIGADWRARGTRDT